MYETHKLMLLMEIKFCTRFREAMYAQKVCMQEGGSVKHSACVQCGRGQNVRNICLHTM